MNAAAPYLKYVHWSEEDRCYVGYCPDLFPWGGVCHGKIEQAVFRESCTLVREEPAELKRERKPLPMASTRAMREAIMV